MRFILFANFCILVDQARRSSSQSSGGSSSGKKEAAKSSTNGSANKASSVKPAISETKVIAEAAKAASIKPEAAKPASVKPAAVEKKITKETVKTVGSGAAPFYFHSAWLNGPVDAPPGTEKFTELKKDDVKKTVVTSATSNNKTLAGADKDVMIIAEVKKALSKTAISTPVKPPAISTPAKPTVEEKGNVKNEPKPLPVNEPATTISSPGQ